MTNGYVESICSISEGQEDAVYALIRRTVNGSTVRYVERLATRQFTDQQDAFLSILAVLQRRKHRRITNDDDRQRRWLDVSG
jgi:hypothetical protein